MPKANAADHTKWILYTWPDATFSAIEVPSHWRYTQQVPASAMQAKRFHSSYDALDLLLRARQPIASASRQPRS